MVVEPGRELVGGSTVSWVKSYYTVCRSRSRFIILHGLGQRVRKSRRLHMCFHLAHPSGINWVAVLNICKEASRSV